MVINVHLHDLTCRNTPPPPHTLLLSDTWNKYLNSHTERVRDVDHMSRQDHDEDDGGHEDLQDKFGSVSSVGEN